jgi:hypothetical protein
MIVRDLLIDFGARLNKSDLSKVDKQSQGFAAKTGGLMTTLLSLGFIKFFKDATIGVLSLASSVVENMNVMNAAFGENVGDVQAWAKSFGDAAGRNRYELEQMAGSLGAMLNPMLKSADAAADMSKKLTELAVDLGSFYNVADQDALVALRAGLVGETEPMRKFGVIMTEASMKAWMLENRIKGNIKTMSVADKTMLRYRYMLEQTSLANGDAIRTADSLANATKALKSKFMEMATDAGSKLIPFAGKVVYALSRVMTLFKQISADSKIVESAFAVLGAAAVALAIKMLLPFLPIILAIGALILVIDDLWTMFEGGESEIGKLIDWLWGPGSAQAAVTAVKQAFADFVAWMRTDGLAIWHEITAVIRNFIRAAAPYIKSFLVGIGDAFVWTLDNVIEPFFTWLIDSAIPAVADFVETAIPYIKFFLTVIGDGLGWVYDNILKPVFGFLVDTAIPIIGKVAKAIGEFFAPAVDNLIWFFEKLFGVVGKVIDEIGNFIDMVAEGVKAAADLFGIDLSTEPKSGIGGTRVGGGAAAFNKGVQAGSYLTTSIPLSAVGAGNYGGDEINQNVEIKFDNAQNISPERVGSNVEDVMKRVNKRALAALKQRKGS